MSHFIDIVRRRAGWFFAAGWAFILLAIAYEFLVGALASMNVFYHPLHKDAPLQLFDRDTSLIAIICLVATGIAATVLFGRKHRLPALAVIVAGCTALFAGLAIAKSFVRLGPEQFVRYIGSQRFIVPWHYNPQGYDRANDQDLSISVCWNDMRGSWESETCRVRRVQISPRSRGLTKDRDWDMRGQPQSTMKREQDRYGLEVFRLMTQDAADQPLAPIYFASRSPSGETTALARCIGGICRYETLIGEYHLYYTSLIEELATWQENDLKIAAAVDSWRAP